MDQAALQRVALVRTSGTLCWTVWGAREQQSLRTWIVSFFLESAVTQMAHSSEEWCLLWISRLTPCFCYCNALQVESMQKCLRRADSMKPENAMTPRLTAKASRTSMIAKRQGSPTSLTFDNVVPVVAGSLNVPTAELFRIFQDVFVPERPAVHCSMQSRR